MYPISINFRILGLFICFIFSNKVTSQKFLKDFTISKDSINKIDKFGKQGQWYVYNSKSEIVEALLKYNNDTLQGYFEYYWTNTGNIQARGFYKNGEIDSIYKTYWQNGKIREIYHVKGGKAHGIMQTFDNDSNILTYNLFINGKMDTNFKEKFRAKNVIVENGQFLKMDTIKDESKYIKAKRYYIYKNDTLFKKQYIEKYNIEIEDLFVLGKLSKRIIYYNNKPNIIEKIFYYNEVENWVNDLPKKIEYFNKKGEYLRTEIKDSEGKWVEDKNVNRE
jgi:antitoxin component YwqK of YwqJK toxin-antitoxin module